MFKENSSINFSELDPYSDDSLRDYQIENKIKIYDAWKKHRSVMLQMPTGTGKTRVFVSIAKDLHNWGAKNKRAVRVLILAHRKELIEQISENVGLKYGLAHGLIVSQNVEQRKYPFQVGSVPTLNRRLFKWSSNDFDVIIIDEAHHVKAQSYRNILKEYPKAKILGVTATPYRLNGAGFRPEFDDLIVSPSISEFIKAGHLSDYEYYSIRPESHLQADIDGMAVNMDGDYLDSAMSAVMDKDEIRANIVNSYLKIANGKKGIVYTVNKEHSRHLKERFCREGIKAEVVDSDTPREERDKIVSKFRRGDITVLLNVNIFSEGFDCPDVEFVQLARPTKSLSMFLQQVGRGLRTSEGKEKVIILDNVGLFNKFGFPSARRKWRYHFEGKHKDEMPEEQSSISIADDDEIRSVFSLEEGDEQVELLHNSKEEIISMDYSDKLLKMSREFENYLIGKGRQAKTVKDYVRAITSEVDGFIRDIIDRKHISLFLIDDHNKVSEILDGLKNDSAFCEYNKEKHNYLTAALGQYLRFLRHRNGEEPSAKEDPVSNDDAKEIEEIKKQLEELESHIHFLMEHGYEVSDKMLKDRDALSRKISESQIDKVLLQALNEFLINEGIGGSGTINYRPRQGIQINYSAPATEPEAREEISLDRRGRRPNSMLRIVFDDSSEICERNAAETFAKFIQHVGAERVASLGIVRNKIALVSGDISPIYSASQKDVGNGLYVLTNIPIATKKEDILYIARQFNINVKVEII